MELKEFIPQETSFKLKIGTAEKELFLRPFNLRDEAWLDQQWTLEERAEIFQKIDMPPICKIVWHQLTLESKKILMSVKVIDMDESGNELEIATSGPEKLMYCMSEGVQQSINVFQSLLTAKGLSTPALEKLAEVNKAVKDSKKKRKAK